VEAEFAGPRQILGRAIGPEYLLHCNIYVLQTILMADKNVMYVT
jgi:hypothetical protein